MKLRVVIVDDEPLAREGIRSFLADETDVEIVAECDHGLAALEAIEKLHPDIVFLDVQMPRLNGFEVIEALSPGVAPAIIFTTAHDQHAIRAFEVNAIDYLLKPFKVERLKRAVQRVREQLQLQLAGGSKPDPQVSSLLTQLRGITGTAPRILVRSPDRILFLKPAEIDYVEAAGNYLVLHAGKDRHTIRDTMTAMEARLTDAGFMRISRSTIVNLGRVRELQPVAAGQYMVLMQNGVRLDMTSGLREFQERLARV
jgi:two-component system, LytTR family, response regulator